jgi:hypothetical protein
VIWVFVWWLLMERAVNVPTHTHTRLLLCLREAACFPLRKRRGCARAPLDGGVGCLPYAFIHAFKQTISALIYIKCYYCPSLILHAVFPKAHICHHGFLNLEGVVLASV